MATAITDPDAAGTRTDGLTRASCLARGRPRRAPGARGDRALRPGRGPRDGIVDVSGRRRGVVRARVRRERTAHDRPDGGRRGGGDRRGRLRGARERAARALRWGDGAAVDGRERTLPGGGRLPAHGSGVRARHRAGRAAGYPGRAPRLLHRGRAHAVGGVAGGRGGRAAARRRAAAQGAPRLRGATVPGRGAGAGRVHEHDASGGARCGRRGIRRRLAPRRPRPPGGDGRRHRGRARRRARKGGPAPCPNGRARSRSPRTQVPS